MPKFTPYNCNLLKNNPESVPPDKRDKRKFIKVRPEKIKKKLVNHLEKEDQVR